MIQEACQCAIELFGTFLCLPAGPATSSPPFLHVVSLAHYAIPCARGWAANSTNARVRLAAENSRLQQGVELLREEIRIRTSPRAGRPAGLQASL